MIKYPDSNQGFNKEIKDEEGDFGCQCFGFFCQKIKLGSDAQNLNFSKRQNKYIMIVFVEK
ncbi:MAG TPA: hypothetical protein PKD16_02360 [Saprospiraceae bacterium]|nr:hypothetical protein [Saprospiraceae bacterium]HMT68973.1 hypothetical protein [Saprospiraceae bacterium]